MNKKQKVVLIEITDDIEFLLGDYIRIQDNFDKGYSRHAVGIDAINLLKAVTDDKDVLEVADLLLNTLELIDAMEEREAWNYDDKYTTKAVKPCEKVVKQLENLESKLGHTPTRYRDMGIVSCAEEYLEP